MTTIDFDPAALREKYNLERDRRLRPEGTAQYVELSEGSSYLVDPFAEPLGQRPAIVEEVDVAILGGGFSGILPAIRLLQEGIGNIRLIEKAGDFGGTWYWNRYPGVQCDVESYIYLPLLEELGYVPTEKYARGAEILQYIQSLARHFDLYRLACFQTRVEEARWDDKAARWVIRTDRDDEITARYVIVGTGASLHRPKLPGIPGLDTFRGRSFHTSRWDYAYTGGTSSGDLHGLADKRVAVIGTGATAVQCVPHLAQAAQHLSVFQRTPSAVDIRGNRPTDLEWFKSLEPGWQKRRMVNFDSLIAGLPQGEDLVGDQWTQIWGIPDLDPPADGAEPDLAALKQAFELYDFAQMERIRSRVDELVDDPATAASLKPYYDVHCKRPCFHDEYLQTFNRPNVTLVDTRGRGVERISEHAVYVDGVAYEVDCIIYATGFEAVTAPDRAGEISVIGRGGMPLQDKWQKVETVHGICCHGFPNLFVVGGIRHTAATVNVTFSIGEQADHVAAVISELRKAGARTMEVTPAAEAAWGDLVRARSVVTEEALRNCTPGFFTNEGKLDGDTTPVFATALGGGPAAYVSQLEEWRRSGLERDTMVTYEEGTAP